MKARILVISLFIVSCYISASTSAGTRRIRGGRNATTSSPNRRATDAPAAVASSPRIRLRRPTPASSDQEQSSSIAVPKKIPAGSSSKSSTSSSSDGKKIVCYYTNWSQYRPKIGKFLPEDIPANMCTHLIFAFGWMKKGKLSSFETNDDTKDGKVGFYEKINNLKKGNPQLKTLLAIGGWSFGTQKFKEMSANYYSRRIFIFSAIPYLRDRNFDGLDIDWEYPKGSEEKVNYALFLKELRAAFEDEAKDTKKPKLLLSAAVPVGPDSIRGGYDVPSVSSSLDFINIMAYDFHGKWESQTGHNAPLFAPSSDSAWRKQLSVSAAVELWMKLGAPKEKLVIGMPTYGRTFTLTDKFNSSVNVATKGGGTAGVYTREGGFLAYYEICEMLRSGNANYVWDDEMKVPYLVVDDQWVGFDDERSIRNKMKWIQDNNFAGAMVWTVDMDDFTGNVCNGENGGKYPLINAMREELLGLPKHTDVDWNVVANGGKKKAKNPVKISVDEALAAAGTKLKNKKKIVPVVVESEEEEDEDDETEDNSKKRSGAVLCYVKSPSKTGLSIENIDPNVCTHVVLAFAKTKDNHLNSEDNETFKKLTALKEKNISLKVLISLDDKHIGPIIESQYRIGQFVYDSMDFLRERNIDGLDLYYSNPKSELITDLIRELRLAFEGEAKTLKTNRLLITMTVPSNIPSTYEVEELSKFVDYFNVLTFDLNAGQNNVQHSSPLFPIENVDGETSERSVSKSVKKWLEAGAPKEKLLIGISTFGRTFKLQDETKFDIGSKVVGNGSKGRLSQETGILSYFEVCEFLDNENTTLVWDNEQMVPFAYRGNQWVGFDDERSLKSKIDWLKEEGIGGVMVWTLDNDDFNGKSCSSGKFPLVKAIAAELKEYKVKLTYNGPHEDNYNDGTPGGNKKKNPNEVTCAEEDGHISYHKDVNDCTKYFMCEGERKHHMPCPAQLVFNINENVCDWPENVEGCGKLP